MIHDHYAGKRVNMQRSSIHQHGVVTGLILALGIAAAGFLMQADLAKVLHGGGQGILAVGILLIAIILVVIRSRAK